MQDPSRRRRSLAKACTWRVFSVPVTLGLVWIATGDLGLSASIGLVDSGIKLFAFYYHDRIWHKILWGKYEESSDVGSRLLARMQRNLDSVCLDPGDPGIPEQAQIPS